MLRLRVERRAVVLRVAVFRGDLAEAVERFAVDRLAVERFAAGLRAADVRLAPEADDRARELVERFALERLAVERFAVDLRPLLFRAPELREAVEPPALEASSVHLPDMTR